MKKSLLISLIILLFGCHKNNLALSVAQSNEQRYSHLIEKIINIPNWNIEAKAQLVDLKHNNSFMFYLTWDALQGYSIVNLRSNFNIKSIILKVYDSASNNIEILEKKENSNHLKLTLYNFLNKSNFKVNNLRYWLRGIPNPKLSYNVNKTGFVQDNWSITYKDFKEIVLAKKNVLVPNMIILEQLGQTNSKNKLKLKIIIRSLSINEYNIIKKF